MTAPAEQYTDYKFFSSVEGHLVPRFGTFQMPSTQFIGAVREGKTTRWNTEQVVAIHPAEYNRYRRELKRAVRDKALTERTVEDYRKWLEVVAKQDEKAGEAAKATAEEAEKLSGGNVPVAPGTKSEDVNKDEPGARNAGAKPSKGAKQ